MAEKLKEYLVFAAHVIPPTEVTDKAARIAWLKAKERDTELQDTFAAIVHKIQTDVAPSHKVKIIHDGSGWKAPDHPFSSCNWIFLKTTEAGIEEIKKIPNLDVHENNARWTLAAPLSKFLQPIRNALNLS